MIIDDINVINKDKESPIFYVLKYRRLILWKNFNKISIFYIMIVKLFLNVIYELSLFFILYYYQILLINFILYK